MLLLFVLACSFVQGGAYTDLQSCPVAADNSTCSSNECSANLIEYATCLRNHFTDSIDGLWNAVSTAQRGRINAESNVLALESLGSCIDPINALNSEINCITDSSDFYLREICIVEDMLEDCRDEGKPKVTEPLEAAQDAIASTTCGCDLSAIEADLAALQVTLDSTGIEALEQSFSAAQSNYDNFIGTIAIFEATFTCTSDVATLQSTLSSVQQSQATLDTDLADLNSVATECQISQGNLQAQLLDLNTELTNLQLIDVACPSDGVGDCCALTLSLNEQATANVDDIAALTSLTQQTIEETRNAATANGALTTSLGSF